MNIYSILLIVSLVFPIASLFFKKTLFTSLLLYPGLLLLIGLMIAGNVFSFSYTSILTLVCVALMTVVSLMNRLPVEGLVKGLIMGLFASAALAATLPATVIYAAQSDHYWTFLYVSVGVTALLAFLYLFFANKGFRTSRIPLKLVCIIFFYLGFASLLFCLFNLFQSRYLLFYFFSILFALLSAHFKNKQRIAGLFMYLHLLGATVFVIAPLIF